MLPADELKPVMNDQIQEAVEVLGIPPSAAAILLREHKWAKERLFQSFFDNPEAVQEKCCVLARCRNATVAGGCVGEKKQIPSRLTRSAPNAFRKCEICMDEDGFDPSEMISMPCGHEFCETCWYGYIANALEKGPLCVRETCPQAGCCELLSEEEVGRVAPDLLPKFENYQLRSFVETYGLTRWCPGPGCGQVALAPGSGGVFADTGGVAKCNACDTAFCLKCGVEPHAPVACPQLAKWQEKCRNESETANWILANTKPCPKCSSRIEKNQGCNVSCIFFAVDMIVSIFFISSLTFFLHFCNCLAHDLPQLRSSLLLDLHGELGRTWSQHRYDVCSSQSLLHSHALIEYSLFIFPHLRSLRGVLQV